MHTARGLSYRIIIGTKVPSYKTKRAPTSVNGNGPERAIGIRIILELEWKH